MSATALIQVFSPGSDVYVIDDFRVTGPFRVIKCLIIDPMSGDPSWRLTYETPDGLVHSVTDPDDAYPDAESCREAAMKRLEREHDALERELNKLEDKCDELEDKRKALLRTDAKFHVGQFVWIYVGGLQSDALRGPVRIANIAAYGRHITYMIDLRDGSSGFPWHECEEKDLFATREEAVARFSEAIAEARDLYLGKLAYLDELDNKIHKEDE